MKALLFVLLFVACKSPTAAKECPRAVELGIQGPGILPCWILAARDRRKDFERATGIRSSCEGDIELRCNGVTAQGTPVKFQGDGRSCELIANWLW